MADGPRSEADTDELPDARSAFEARGREREDDAGAVARAGALLALVRPQRLTTATFREVIADAREFLGVVPVDPSESGRDSLEQMFDTLGELGQRAIAVMASLERKREPELPPDLGPGFSSERFVMQTVSATDISERDALESVQAAAARAVFEAETADAERQEQAIRLAAASLLDPDPLVQVAAAAATRRLDPMNPLADAILDEATFRGDEIAELSRAVLTTDRELERRRIEVEHPGAEPDLRPDAAMVHGTWARRGDWWRPDGQLHRYLCEEERIFPNLYRGRQPFRWSGYFSFRAWKPVKTDWDRQQAADSLAWWAHRKLLAPPDLIGHSYGGSLALLATQAEKSLRGVVLLSPALHRTCLPNPRYYERILHVTTKLDLVLMADLANARLLRGLRDVDEWTVKRRGLSGHRATRDPRCWAASGLTAHVRDTWLPSLTARP